MKFSKVAIAVGAAALCSMAVAQAQEVNPFTGKPAAAEQSRRAAENVRAENQLLEERIRQLNLMSDLESAPLRKKAELDKLIEQNRARQAALAPPPEPSKQTRTPKPQTAPVIPVVTAPPPPPAPVVPPPPPPPELRGTIKTKDGVSAIIDNQGRTIIARPGERTSIGVVDEVTHNSARVGESDLALRPGKVARRALTDPAPMPAAGAPLPVAPAAAPALARPAVVLPPGAANAR